MFDEWEPIALFVIGMVGLVVGIGFRAGRLRRWAALYRNASFPKHRRNAIFALIPYGLVFLLWWLAVALHEAGVSGVAVAYAFILSVAVMFFGLVVQFRPPAWMKPRWLRDEEEGLRLPLGTDTTASARDAETGRSYTHDG